VLPGARRLLEHARAAGLKVAVATSTSRATFGARGLAPLLFPSRAPRLPPLTLPPRAARRKRRLLKLPGAAACGD
jgi:hypothetical protein